MRKSVFLMAVAGIFMGFGWRADHAMKMRKMENVETGRSAPDEKIFSSWICAARPRRNGRRPLSKSF